MSIVCTRSATHTRWPFHAVAVIVCLSIVLSSCSVTSDDAEPTATTSTAPVEPTTSIIGETPPPEITVEPTRSAALEELLAPGPSAQAPDGIFFQSGSDVWFLPGGENARRVVEGQRIGPWAQTSDGARIALVRYRDQEGQGVEEIVIVDSDGTTGEPVYGPVATSGAGGAAAIQALDWSWDAQRLAAIFSNGTMATMRFDPNDPFRTRPPFEPIPLPADDETPTALEWAPNGAGITYLLSATDGSTLYSAPLGDDAQYLVTANDGRSRSVRAFDWLPGRGRIAFVENPDGRASHLAGSIFTIAPDGKLLELLVSAGQFAPAASVTDLRASPDGRALAFTVYAPNRQGQRVFQSLWILTIDSGELRQVPVESGYRVVDMIWSASGLVWRGVDRNTRLPTDGRTFSADDPFILSRFDPADGSSTVVFQSALAG